ncbi:MULTISPECIES: nuclear transport factor 2 family protein [unclassified Pseudofrankia]|uniref:nuclear transport factor 2 family protein n=1 Tax=unclassified Pseudofrankia TaxID=2994372 RepID=UPI0008DA55EB|nr:MULTISPECIES: nuclear transport factor 2 family protein [unclassified Pseudofrankia]MDT3440165.1 nuclear transport factor 2 family protein [Pseudofrankia sp. BMG5.37]OHV42618.1 hypothetical protein BCD48_30695 [Pseudofrankia sp. BMG5.36]
MSADDRIEELTRKVAYLMDRTAILDCIARAARGHDRHDVELMTSTFHEDGIDEHGFAVNPGPEYGEWANKTHAAASQAHLHHITTHSCEIDGDVAHAESYVLGGLLSPDGKTMTLLGGRYLDRLERRDGEWKIVVRRSTAEWLGMTDSSFVNSKIFRSQGFLKGTRDQTDLSYQRPLNIDSEPAQRW